MMSGPGTGFKENCQSRKSLVWLHVMATIVVSLKIRFWSEISPHV